MAYTKSVNTGDAELIELEIADLILSELLPIVPTEADVRLLADTIKKVKKPVGLIRVTATNSNLYEVIDGAEYYLAYKESGLGRPIHVLSEYMGTDRLVSYLYTKAKLDCPISEASWFKKVKTRCQWTTEELATRLDNNGVKLKRSTIDNSIRLLSLAEGVQKLIKSGLITKQSAKHMCAIKSKPEQLRMAKKCLNLGWSDRQLYSAIEPHLNKKQVGVKQPDGNTDSHSKDSTSMQQGLIEKSVPSKKQNPPKDVNVANMEIELSNKVGCPTSINEKNGNCVLEINAFDGDCLAGLSDYIYKKMKNSKLYSSKLIIPLKDSAHMEEIYNELMDEEIF